MSLTDKAGALTDLEDDLLTGELSDGQGTGIQPDIHDHPTNPDSEAVGGIEILRCDDHHPGDMLPTNDPGSYCQVHPDLQVSKGGCFEALDPEAGVGIHLVVEGIPGGSQDSESLRTNLGEGTVCQAASQSSGFPGIRGLDGSQGITRENQGGQQSA